MWSSSGFRFRGFMVDGAVVELGGWYCEPYVVADADADAVAVA
jgi:hypothetical protein